MMKMNMRVMAIALVGLVLGSQAASGQTPFGYRGYALESSVASVVKMGKLRADAIRTLHERPARIQQVEWRAPYVSAGTEMADPVRDVRFRFFDDQLYEIVVNYDRDRMEGLTDADLMESISTTYGVPLLRHARVTPNTLPTEIPTNATVVAQWEDATSLLTLTRTTYSPQYQLVLTSKALDSRAGAAITEAVRLDTQEAPERERDRRSKQIADARDASQKARVVNKAAFKP